MQVIGGAGVHRAPTNAGRSTHWVEHLSVPDLSVGTYSIADGGPDTQSPHAEDEIYVVTAGTATLVADAATAPVGPGSVVYVPAGEGHRFVDVSGGFTTLVIFAPAEGSRAGRPEARPAP